MPKRTSKTGGELFIVDNSDDDWKVLRYLRDWCDLSKGLDVATGYFEIGSLLALDGQWQKLDKIRLLMGDEVSKRTKAAFAAGLLGLLPRARRDHRPLARKPPKTGLRPDSHAIPEAVRKFGDLDEVAGLLEELKKVQPEHDDKLKALIKLLRTDPVLKKHKVLIFSEFADTARYLRSQLDEEGIEGVYELDSASKTSRAKIIRRFAPYYNGLSSGLLTAAGEDEIRVLISTDVLSEGLNLQDATRLINYDLHWNPVRLMQRIGRVDRRMNPETEAKLLA
ncbi:MAG: helicase-related protein, partial [Pirellulales bacterium]